METAHMCFYLKQTLIHIFLFCFLTRRLIVVDIYPLQLQVTVTLVAPGGIDAMLIAYHLPELRWEQT